MLCGAGFPVGRGGLHLGDYKPSPGAKVSLDPSFVLPALSSRPRRANEDKKVGPDVCDESVSVLKCDKSDKETERQRSVS